MSAGFRVVVLGGYGNFGAIIARSLTRIEGVEVVTAGRDPARAQLVVDVRGPDLASRLASAGPSLVISTAGPFQGQDYGVARASLAAGAHYIDIADGRDFVCGIGALDNEAKARGLLAVSGASSVPALSSAVVDELAQGFRELHAIDVGISASSRMPGVATVRSVLAYCGKPIARWTGGAWRQSHGWQGLRRHRFRDPPMTRWLCDCDVPDLAIFPSRYAAVRDVRFGAGVERTAMQAGLWLVAAAARAGFIRDAPRLAPALRSAGVVFEAFGSGRSAMFVNVSGIDRRGAALRRCWELRAECDDGIHVPCMAAVALARKLAAGAIEARGAMPCVGMISLPEYLAELTGLRVRAAIAQ